MTNIESMISGPENNTCWSYLKSLSMGEIPEMILMELIYIDYNITMGICIGAIVIVLWALFILIAGCLLPPCILTLINYTQKLMDIVANNARLLLTAYICLQIVASSLYGIDFFLATSYSDELYSNDMTIERALLVTVIASWILLILYFDKKKSIFYNLIFIAIITALILFIFWYAVIKEGEPIIPDETSFFVRFLLWTTSGSINIVVKAYQTICFIIDMVVFIHNPCLSSPVRYLTVIQLRMLVITVFLIFLELICGYLSLGVGKVSAKVTQKGDKDLRKSKNYNKLIEEV
ncbi:hypothetical protein NECID01_0640 [Nematocida sp. AWRm77]|nr:hypothetical protein NECID01_0640 [Nematocida sp. AWRm77]